MLVATFATFVSTLSEVFFFLVFAVALLSRRSHASRKAARNFYTALFQRNAVGRLLLFLPPPAFILAARFRADVREDAGINYENEPGGFDPSLNSCEDRHRHRGAASQKQEHQTTNNSSVRYGDKYLSDYRPSLNYHSLST